MKNFDYKFVLFIPILFAVAENTTGFFPGGTLNPGTIRGFIAAVFLFFFVFKHYPANRTSLWLLVFVVYYTLLSLFSTNLTESLYGLFKFAIATLMYPVGYYFINNYKRFYSLTVSFAIGLGIFLLSILIANIFKLGTSDYLEDSLYFGAGRVNITKSALILLFASLNIIPVIKRRYKYLFFSFMGTAAFFTVVGIKRSVLLSFIAGIIIFLFFNRLKRGATQLVVISIFAMLFLLLLFPRGYELFSERFDARSGQIEISDESMDKETRVDETQLVINTWIDGSIKHKLFGSELFNDRYFFNVDRMLHTDYMVVLNGSGLVGIFLWFFVLFLIFIDGRFYWKYNKTDARFSLLMVSFYSIICAQLLMSISGTIQGIGLRSFILLYLGAIVGTLKGEARLKLQRNEP